MKELIASYRNWTFQIKAMAYQGRIQVSGHGISHSNDSISHKFNLEGPIPTIQTFFFSLQWALS